MYLMIRNRGVADPAAFTLLGVSTTRNSGCNGTIGQFGSGSKHSVALLLRNFINPIIITGNLKMEFFTKPRIIKGEQFDQVCVKYGGKDLDGTNRSATEDLGFSLQWGTQDWSKVSMAFREFVSNAIDGETIMGGSYKDVEIEVVDKPRAKADHTAVFLPLNEEIQKCWKMLGGMFLHFSHPEYLSMKLLPKINPDRKVTLIYKKGVLVSKVEEDSVFDYNFGDELTLDESRNAQIWDVRYACTNAVSNANAGDLASVLNAQLSGKQVWENKLETYYLASDYDCAEVKERKSKNFHTAFQTVAGENAVLCSGTEQVAQFVEKKGFKPVKLAENWHNALKKYGIKSESEVLNGLEQEGKTEFEPTQEMLDCTKKVWTLFETFNLTNGKPMPKVKGFNSVMDGGSQTHGYYKLGGDTIYLHTNLGVGKMMFKVALEEIVHYLSQSRDCSRDIQDYLFNLITEMGY